MNFSDASLPANRAFTAESSALSPLAAPFQSSFRPFRLSVHAQPFEPGRTFHYTYFPDAPPLQVPTNSPAEGMQESPALDLAAFMTMKRPSYFPAAAIQSNDIPQREVSNSGEEGSSSSYSETHVTRSLLDQEGEERDDWVTSENAQSIYSPAACIFVAKYTDAGSVLSIQG